MNKKKLLSSLAVAGILSVGVLGASVNATTVENYVKPLGRYKGLVDGKTIVPYVLEDRETPITVKDIKSEFRKVTKVHESEDFNENDVIKTGSTFTASGVDYTVVVYGDVNKDGKVSTADARLIQRMVLDEDLRKDPVVNEAADVRYDHNVSTGDARAVQQVVLGAPMTAPSLEKEDKTAPVLSGVPTETVYVNKGSEYTLPTVTATDDYDGELDVETKIQKVVGEAKEDVDAISIAEDATYEVTYTATDKAGNEVSEAFTVVVDSNGPKLSGVIDGEKIYIKQNAEYALPEVTATDIVDGNLTVSHSIKKVVGEEKEDASEVATTEEGTYEITYSAKDSLENEVTATLTVVIDGTAPTKADVKYSTTQNVNAIDGVTVTIESNEALQEIEGWTLSEDKQSMFKKYSKNADNERIVIQDLAGNEKEAFVTIRNIDEGVENLNVAYSPVASQPTNDKVTVTISATEELQEVEGWTLAVDKMSMTHDYTTNVVTEVVVKDLLGNEAKAPINIQHIDKVAPVVEVKFDITELTKEDVTVTLLSNEKLQALTTEQTDAGWTLAEDAMSMSKTYTANATEEVVVADLAGNEKKVPVKVENIDKDAPVLSVSYDITISTNQNVTATIQSNEKLATLTAEQVEAGWTLAEDAMSISRVYEANATEDVTVSDLVGHSSTITVTISNIDKDAPVVGGFTEGKNSYKTVTPTFTEGEALLQKEGEASQKYTSETPITIDGKYTLTVRDAAGNSTVKEFTIDNVAPVFATLDNVTLCSTSERFNTEVKANDNVDGDITATCVITYDKGGVNEAVVTEIDNTDTTGSKDGVYTLDYTATDEAGNTAAATRTVTVDATPATVVSLQSSNPNSAKEVTMFVTFSEKMQLQTGWIVMDGDAQTKFSKKYTQNTTETIEFKDIAGNTTSVNINVKNIDSDEPSITVVPSTTDPTNQDVVVTLRGLEELQAVDGWTLAEDKMSMTKTYSANAEETVVIRDLAGNKTEVVVTVANIDKDIPTGTATYSTSDPTKEDVVVTITAVNTVGGEAELLKPVAGWTLADDKKSMTKTYTANTVAPETVTISDLAGNTCDVTVTVSNIDKEAPEIEGFTEDVSSYQTLTLTFTDENAPIEVGYQKGAEEPITETKASAETITFDQEGSYKLTATDALGNKVEKIFDIDTTNPVVEGVVEGSRYKEATATFTEGIGELSTKGADGSITSTVKYVSGTKINTDGSYQLVVKDAAGNTTTINFIVATEGPKFVIGTEPIVNNKTYIANVIPNATTSGTIASYTLTKDGEAVADYVLGTTELTESGVYVLTATDDLGNTSSVTFTIDKVGPEVTGFTEGQSEYQQVTPVFTESGATATLKKGSEEAKPFTSGTLVDAEDTYVLTVTDANGNNTVINFTIDKTAPSLTGVTEGGLYNTAVTPLNAANDVKTVELLKNGKKVESYTTLGAISEDGEYTLTVKDEAGNSTVVNFTIDTKVEGVQCTYSNNGGPTNQNVWVTITSDEDIIDTDDILKTAGWTLSADKRTLTKEFTANTTVDVVIKDEAGNSETVHVNVTGIDKTAPTVSATTYEVDGAIEGTKDTYTITDPTKGPVYVTIEASEEIKLTDEQQKAGWSLVEGDNTKMTKTYTENATETVTIYDLAGNAIENPVEITLENIYHQGPTITGMFIEETIRRVVTDKFEIELPTVTATNVKGNTVNVVTSITKVSANNPEVTEVEIKDGKLLAQNELCTYTITYTATDVAGNTTTVVRTIEVVASI